MKAEILVQRGNHSVIYALFSTRSSDIILFEENRERLEKAGMVMQDGGLYASKKGEETFKRVRRKKKSFVEAACPECGSTNIVIRPQVKNLSCNDCGMVSYTVRGGVRVSSMYTRNR